MWTTERRWPPGAAMSDHWNTLASRRRFLRFVAGSPLVALAGSADNLFETRPTRGARPAPAVPAPDNLTQDPHVITSRARRSTSWSSSPSRARTCRPPITATSRPVWTTMRLYARTARASRSFSFALDDWSTSATSMHRFNCSAKRGKRRSSWHRRAVRRRSIPPESWASLVRRARSDTCRFSRRTH